MAVYEDDRHRGLAVLVSSTLKGVGNSGHHPRIKARAAWL
jgi:hypothetical protein